MNRLVVVAVLSGCSYAPGAGSIADDDGPTDGTLADAPIDTVLVTSDWAFKRTLTINNQIIGNLTGFPLHVSLDPTRITHANTKANGADLRFEDATGPLAYEIERWNPAGISTIWVRVPAIAANTNTDLTMYYGNPDAPDAQNTPAVWDADYLGVWHLADAHDSTASSTSSNQGGTALEGKLGPAMDFSGINDAHVDTGLMTFTAQWTVEAWVNPAGLAPVGAASSPVSGFPNYMLLYGCNTAPFCQTALFNHNGGTQTSFASFGLVANVWNYVVGRYDGVTIRAFVSGLQIGTNPTTATPDAATVTTKIGSRMDLDGDFDGGIDEVRISKVARSTDYITAQFRSMSDTYLTYGPQMAND